jgi:hypothetical protein
LRALRRWKPTRRANRSSSAEPPKHFVSSGEQVSTTAGGFMEAAMKIFGLLRARSIHNADNHILILIYLLYYSLS